MISFVLIAIASLPSADVQNKAATITPCFEFLMAREAFLEAADDAARRTHFAGMANHWKHGIPKDHDDLDEPIMLRVRDVSFAAATQRSDCVGARAWSRRRCAASRPSSLAAEVTRRRQAVPTTLSTYTR